MIFGLSRYQVTGCLQWILIFWVSFKLYREGGNTRGTCVCNRAFTRTSIMSIIIIIWRFVCRCSLRCSLGFFEDRGMCCPWGNFKCSEILIWDFIDRSIEMFGISTNQISSRKKYIGNSDDGDQVTPKFLFLKYNF